MLYTTDAIDQAGPLRLHHSRVAAEVCAATGATAFGMCAATPLRLRLTSDGDAGWTVQADDDDARALDADAPGLCWGAQAVEAGDAMGGILVQGPIPAALAVAPAPASAWRDPAPEAKARPVVVDPFSLESHRRYLAAMLAQ